MIVTDLSKLREPCLDVKEDEVKELISLLDKELNEANSKKSFGIGLAAPQIGIAKKAAIVRLGEIKVNLINCDFSNGIKPMVMAEGCLSFPGITCNIERFYQVSVENNFLGSHKAFSCWGVVAQCVQHEIQHYQSILMTDLDIIQEPPDNMPCPCGSKIKYKKCCKKKKETK